MKILVLYTLSPQSLAAGRDGGEFDLRQTAEGIAAVLPGAALLGVRGELLEIVEALKMHQPDVVFNACEAPLGRPDREAHVAAVLEWMGVRFTGSGSETLALCRRKDRVNAVLHLAGVPVPRNGVLPCIVKPADEDGSAGIDAASVCTDAASMQRARARLTGPVVTQEFLPGREFAVSLWGREEPDYVCVCETRFKGGLRLNTYAAKWDPSSTDFMNSPLHYEPDLETGLRDSLVSAARAAWRVVAARGYLSVDVRLDGAGIPRVLDVNPNPELAPDGIYPAVAAAGWSWERFVRQQIAWA